MATSSVIYAAMEKFDGLSAGGFPGGSRPSVYLDEAPVVDGSQLYPPYAILRDNGEQFTSLGFERSNLYECAFTIELYYESLADAATAVWAVRLNGGAIGAGSGFDYGTLSTLSVTRTPGQILPPTIRYGLEGYGKASKPVYKAVMDYRITVTELA